MPHDIDDQVRAVVFIDEKPDIPALNKEWTDALASLDYYLEQTRRNYDTRRNYWAGKTPDNRKRGPNAKPWDGASDMDCHVVEERVLKLVSLCLRGLERSHIQAFPVGEDDITRARIVSRFLKWMRENWIEDFHASAERSANYWFEKMLMITHVGWESREIQALERFNFEDLSEEEVEVLDDPEYEPLLITILQERFGVSEKRARKAIREFRDTGYAELPVSKGDVNRPTVRACAPDGDVFFPSWVTDPQKSPYVFYRELVTPQELLGRAKSGAEEYRYDKKWVDHVITHCRGRSTQTNPGINNRNNIPNNPLSRYQSVDSGLIELVWTYQRLIDEESSAEGIYCTIFCPQYTDDTGKAQNYAVRYLLDGATRYPLVVTRLFDDEQRMYDGRPLPDLLRSAQNAVKGERDARADANGLRNCPPMEHPAGRPPKGNWSPGGRIGYRRAGEVHFADTPKHNPQSMADEEIMLTQADRLLGLDHEDPTGSAIQDYFVGRFLRHQAKVLEMAYEQFQRYGPDELMFRITGYPDQQVMENRQGEKLDITITFDSLFNDPDSVEKMIANVGTLFSFDDQGRIDKSAWITLALQSVSPIFAQQLIKPSDESKRDFQRKVVDDLTRIRAGFEVNAQPQGAPMAIEVVQQWANQPDVMAELQENQLFQGRLEKYLMQYVFTMQQQENAVTGRLGTPPAAFDVTEGTPPARNGSRV